MVTAKQVKSALGITSDKYDDRIDTLIPLIYELVKVRCNLPEVPEGHQDTVIQIIGFRIFTKVGAVSESLSRHSESYDPEFEEKQLKKIGRRLKW